MTHQPSPGGRRIRAEALWAEPFRLFVPAAALAGALGALVWPLHFGGVLALYPGQSHARLMAHGFFGGLILGFLGTALPRMLSSRRFTAPEILALLALHLATVTAHVLGRIATGDALFLALLLVLAAAVAARVAARREMPPPGFVLVGLALACGGAGAILSLQADRLEDAFFWLALRPLLYYQGFVLLPILGVGPFILPRFFGLPSRHEFAESRHPPPGWTRKALAATAVGLAVIATFGLEAGGHPRWAHLLRGGLIVGYLLAEVPVHRSKARGQSLALALRIALGLLGAGFLGVALFGVPRVGLLHLSLAAGAGVLALAVATRVVFGHSGNRGLLSRRLRWFTVGVILMVAGIATRVSGDLWPKILPTHYSYGALAWVAGLALWSWHVLPRVLQADPDD